jgi:hypothetical protein
MASAVESEVSKSYLFSYIFNVSSMGIRHKWERTLQQKIVNITGFICTEVRQPSRRCTFDELESMAVASRRRWRMFQPLLRCLRLCHKKTALASGCPAREDVW